MYQKIIVPIDHGNRNMKTEHGLWRATAGPRWGSICIIMGAIMPLQSSGYPICGIRRWMTVSSS